MTGRTIALGDIHGCGTAFSLVLRQLELTSEDTLVVLGDVIDRGPSTAAVIDRLLELKQQCQLITLAGNHEEMMFSALGGGDWQDSWLRYGGQEMLDSYGGSPESIPKMHLELLRSMQDLWETETEVFVHAGIDPQVPLAEQTARTLRWEHVRGDEPPLEDGRRIICGHTAQKSGLPLIWPGWMCLDTWVYGDGYLTAFDLGSEQFYQASEQGKQREFHLSQLTD